MVKNEIDVFNACAEDEKVLSELKQIGLLTKLS